MTYSMMRFAAYDWAKGVVHTGKLLFVISILPLALSFELMYRLHTHTRLEDGVGRKYGWRNSWIFGKPGGIDHGQDAG
jgi:hypothetical protein